VSTPVLFVIDVQERLFQAMPEDGRISLLKALPPLIQLAGHEGWKIWVTEQYPKGLGLTIPEIKAVFPPSALFFEKSEFDACLNAAVAHRLRMLTLNTPFILVGIEAHVCVYLTAMSLKAFGFPVTVLSGAVASRNASDSRIALEALARAGVCVIPYETFLFQTLGHKDHPFFKPVSQMIR
jgi:nicotinamidase-related amidase